MKKIALIIAVFALVNFAAAAETVQPQPVIKDTVRDIKNQPKPAIVKNRQQRMRMQLKQIKYHDKQLKKVHQAQQKLKKEQRREHL